MRLIKDKEKTGNSQVLGMQKKPFSRLATAATAALISLSPAAARIARAEDAPQPPAPAASAPASAEEPAEPSSAPAGTDARPGSSVESGNLVITRPEISRMDLALSPTPDEVDLAGRRRPISLSNSWDMGGNVYANEAGSSIWGSIRYTYRGSGRRPFYARVDGGNIWFGEQAAPFARLYARPAIEFWNFKLAYYGSVGFMGNMPSYLYTSHSVGFGYSQPIGDNFRLRVGAVIGGALSYPAWDDIYLNLATGISAEISDFLVYLMPNFYFAAPDPIKTAYMGYYRPQFQNMEFGIQYRFLEDQYTARVFGDWGTINQRVGARVTRTINFSDTVAGDIYVAGGATHWDNSVGGRWDPLVMLGINIIVGGRNINSTNTVRYEHMQSGGVRFAQTDLPTVENPGPYGFGRSGNPDIDAQINQAKQRILSNGSFSGFTSSYRGASQGEVIMAARFLGAFLQQVAYANDAWSALSSTRFFDPSVTRIAGTNTDQMYSYIQRYVQFYNSNSPQADLPEDLRSGIAICAGIHHVMAEFLRSNGVPTIVASVNTPNGPHVIAIAQPADSTVLLDYGNTYTTPANTFDQAMRFYGQNRQAPTFQSQLFGPDGYIGTYETSEGRLLHRSIGIVNMEVLAHDFLGVR